MSWRAAEPQRPGSRQRRTARGAATIASTSTTSSRRTSAPTSTSSSTSRCWTRHPPAPLEEPVGRHAEEDDPARDEDVHRVPRLLVGGVAEEPLHAGAGVVEVVDQEEAGEGD